MVAAMRFTSTARKDGRWWVVQNDQHAGALSQVTRLADAEAHQREAIAFVAGLDETDVDVEVHVQLQPAVQRALERAASMRERAHKLERDAGERRRAAAVAMKNQGYTVRDIGEVLGVSYQRAHQLVAEAANRGSAMAAGDRTQQRRTKKPRGVKT